MTSVFDDDIYALQEQLADLEDALVDETERADENERLAVNLFYALRDVDRISANRIWHDEQTLSELIPAKHFKREPGTCLHETGEMDGMIYCALTKSYVDCSKKCKFD